MTSPDVPSTFKCPNCEYEVPALNYCVRCGERLEDDYARHPRGGRGFAAAPNEPRFAPRLSTLFPQLPRTEMETFQAAAGLGTAAIVVLALFKLFPLALVVAAVLTPLLLILYLWEVDLYEDEPLNVLGVTIAWGAAAGVVVGFLSKAVVDADAGFSFEISGHDLAWRGILIPLISVALMFAGPLILLPYRKFNDVMDGATFGAACAVSFVGAELLTHASDFLAGGLRPPGETVAWVLRLLGLGIELPVLAAGAVGAAAGALWLRYRAPVTDRKALGLLGNPLVAVPVAVGFVVGAALIQLYLQRWWEFVLLGVLMIASLLWLRQVIDVGLNQEATEIEIGEAVACPNCGRETPRHTFCGYCGISLQALPKSVRPMRPWATPEGVRAPEEGVRGRTL